MSAPVQTTLRNDLVSLVRDKALWIRRRSFQMVYEAQLGHPGGDFSSADILAALYFGVLRFDAAKPNNPARDRFPATAPQLNVSGFVKSLGSHSGQPSAGDGPFCGSRFQPTRW